MKSLAKEVRETLVQMAMKEWAVSRPVAEAKVDEALKRDPRLLDRKDAWDEFDRQRNAPNN